MRKQQTGLSQQSEEKISQLDSLIEDRTVLSTVQIVRSFLELHPVAEILEADNGSQLVFVPASNTQTEPEIIQFERFKDELAKPELIISEKQDDIDAYTDFDYLEEEEVLEFHEDQIINTENSAATDDEDYDENFDFNESSVDMSVTSANDSSEATKPALPHRPRNPETWACNKRKALRNSGKTYLSSKGKIVEARRMYPSCGEKCRSHCINRITEEDRQFNFNGYWALGDVVKQRMFINSHITQTQPRRRRVVNSNRSITLKFYLDVRNVDGTTSMVQVCKNMFKNTLVVSAQVIQGVIKKYAKAGFVDPRGKHARKLTEGQKYAREHVQKFPFFYIDGTMTIIQVYQLYVKECQEKRIDAVKESYYRDIFDKHNNNGFLKTEKTLCELCPKYFAGSEADRLELQKSYDEHIALNKRCRARALARIRNKRALEKKTAEKLVKEQNASQFSQDQFSHL